MLDYLISVVSRTGHWGYLAIFAAATLESAAFLGLFIPGESLVLVTGFLAAQGLLDLDVAIWTVTLGAIAGDSLGYELGRRLDRATLLRYLMYRREWYWFASLIVTVPTGMLVNTLMKLAFHRARPSLDHPIASLAGYSFPSGHAAGATLFFGLLAGFVICKAKSWSWRVAVFLAPLALVIVVSFSRMYIGTHYLSDVLGGMTEGVAWLAFCLTGIHTYRGHRATHLEHQPRHQGARSR